LSLLRLLMTAWISMEQILLLVILGMALYIALGD
jgi:hypothetical protein